MFAITRKDLIAEFHSREIFSAMLVFSLLVILIFNFALELDIATRRSVTAGVLWVTFAFAGTLGLNRSMAVEKIAVVSMDSCSRRWIARRSISEK